MSAIPISVNIGAATVYPQQSFVPFVTSLKTGTGKVRVNCIPFQFTYQATPIWVINATTQLLNIFDAIRGFFVDNTQSANDVTIFNVTTGFQVLVPAKSSGFYPFLAQDGDISFYVQNNGGTGTDKTNVYALDTPYPPANYPEYQRVLQNGLGSGGVITPEIVATKCAVNAGYNSGFNPTGGGLIIINNSVGHWYVESLFITIISAGSGLNAITLYDTVYGGTSNPIFQSYWDGSLVVPVTGIKYTSQAKGNYLLVYTAGNSADYISVTAYYAVLPS